QPRSKCPPIATLTAREANTLRWFVFAHSQEGRVPQAMAGPRGEADLAQQVGLTHAWEIAPLDPGAGIAATRARRRRRRDRRSCIRWPERGACRVVCHLRLAIETCPG